MAQFDLFRRLNSINGNTPQDILLNEEIRNFEYYLTQSPNKKTINKYKPIILMEVWENHHGSTSLEHTKKLFNDLLNIYDIIRLDFTCDYLFIKKV